MILRNSAAFSCPCSAYSGLTADNRSGYRPALLPVENRGLDSRFCQTSNDLSRADCKLRANYVPHAPNGALQAKKLERETGIEPATNSLEGCDSTTELLPQESG